MARIKNPKPETPQKRPSRRSRAAISKNLWISLQSLTKPARAGQRGIGQTVFRRSKIELQRQVIRTNERHTFSLSLEQDIIRRNRQNKIAFDTVSGIINDSDFDLRHASVVRAVAYLSKHNQPTRCQFMHHIWQARPACACRRRIPAAIPAIRHIAANRRLNAPCRCA